jgi:hypothetical protein
MTQQQLHARRAKALVFALVVSLTAVVLSVRQAGSAHADLDDELTVVDEQGRTLTVQQWDTNIQELHSLDRNRLTREWFYSGHAVYAVAGEKADEFAGELLLGYQVGFPWSLGVGINFSYTTPNVLIDGGNFTPDPSFDPLVYVITPNLLPGLSISADLGNGPGVQEVITFTASIKGAEGDIMVTDAHGMVTGAAGGVLLRPFARLNSDDGATVTTYGRPWDLA